MESWFVYLSKSYVKVRSYAWKGSSFATIQILTTQALAVFCGLWCNSEWWIILYPISLFTKATIYKI